MINANALYIPLKDGSVQMICTSSPYWGLRDYLVNGQLGLEKTPEEYVENTVKWAREVWRVLRKDGCFWLNLGDSYYTSSGGWNENISTGNAAALKEVGRVKRNKHCTLKPKDLCGIPWKVVFALQADGWWLRSAMPWVKRSAMPESCTDRPASALEYMFLLTKSQKYYFDMDAIRVGNSRELKGDFRVGGNYTGGQSFDNSGVSQPTNSSTHTQNGTGRNFRNTDLFYQSLEEPHGAIFCGDEMVGLDVNPQAYKDAHFATFPEWLVTPLIKAGTSEKGACPECGAPWERLTEKEYGKDNSSTNHIAGGDKTIGQGWEGTQRRADVMSKTIGWQPTCKCGHKETVPCVVLDPFGGSGTTKNVADRLGRRGVICELKMEYIEMAKKRCYQEPGLF